MTDAEAARAAFKALLDEIGADDGAAVFQAGLGGVAGPELAAAVSEAGGLGHLGGIRMGASALRAWIRDTRARTAKPFGVNLVPPGGGADGFEGQLAVVLEERPRVLSLFWGDFARVIPRAKAAGILTMVQVGSVAEAIKAARDGADAIIAQGIEAGGHVRGRVGLAALLPAVVDALAPRPVLAAGGIADRRSVRAALALGAAGVWVGTRFAASAESLAHEVYKRRLVEAGTDDALYSRGYSYGWGFGAPHRALRPPARLDPLALVAGGARRNDKPSHARRIRLYAGQGVGMIREVAPAAEIVRSLSRAPLPRGPSPERE